MDRQTSSATLKQRLWDFFCAHLLFNFCALLPLGLFYYFSRMVYEPGVLQYLLSLPCLLAIAAYFPLGAWRARKKQWGAASLGCNALTAFLPPLLFTLGSYWQSKRQTPPQP